MPPTEFHADASAPRSSWQRALQRFQRWDPTLRLSLVAGLLWLVGAWHVVIAPIAPLTRLELALDDMRQSAALAPVARPRDDIVIVDIDDASLRALGRWPWPRERLAQLVETLFDDDHAAALGIDLVLAEPDDQTRTVRDALAALTQLAPDDAALRASVTRWQGTLEARADHDARLARALAGHPVTLAYHFNHDAEAPAPGHAPVAVPPPITEADVLPASVLAMTPWQGVEAPVPALLRAASGAGFINALPDADGELRSALLVTGYDGAVYESFALSLWRSPGFELLLLALVLAAVTMAVRRLAGPAAVLALLLILAALLLCDLWALTGRGWVIPIAAPLLAGLLLGVLGIVANYLREWHSRRSLAQLLSASAISAPRCAAAIRRSATA